MAKVTHEKPLDRRQVVKARRLIHYKSYKGKPNYAQKWPKPRGPQKKPRPKAWIEHFVKWAHWSKQPDPCAVATSTTLAPTTGYWPRDIIHRAGNGKITHHRPNVPLSSPLPYLFMRPPNKRYEGPPRVITPTVFLQRKTDQALAANTPTPLVFTTKVWDNNAFWDSASAPTVLTFRADGLYFLLAEVKSTTGSGNYRQAWWQHGNGDVLAYDEQQNTLGFGSTMHVMVPYYFYAGETVRLFGQSNGGSDKFQVNFASIMAITPETII